MATNIPTVEEFNEELPVSSWNRTTVADGNWLQANTIGPLKNRDDKIIELLQDVNSAGNSWKKWSEDNSTYLEGDNNYYIGSGNSAFGRAKIIGDNNIALNSDIIGDNNVGISTSELIKKEGTVGHYETVGIYPAQNFIVGDGNVATKSRNAFIFGNNNYTETTEADLQLDCIPEEPNIEGQNNDGFTLAFGLCNSAIRNYDMAIGKDVLASGGENIVIGAPIETHAEGTRVPYRTGSIGYRNLNIRSKVDGVGNKAFESIVTSNTNNFIAETQDNNLEYSDVFISGNPSYKVQLRRNAISHAEDISVKTSANNDLIVHNNEFNNVSGLHFIATNGDEIPAVEANTIIKAEQLDITANRFANNNLYDVHHGNLNINEANFNIFKNINSPIKIEANKFHYNLLLNTNIPKLSGDSNGDTCYANNIFYNIANGYNENLTWTIKGTMENNIFLNSNSGYDNKLITLENPKYVSNNIVFHSILYTASAEGRDDTIINNVLINSTLNANYNGRKTSEDSEFAVNNFLFNAVLTSEPSLSSFVVTGINATGGISIKSHQIDNPTLGQNIIFGATAKNIAGSFIFSDGESDSHYAPSVCYSNRIVAFGDEFVSYSNDSTYLGNDNSAHFNNNCFIAGERNKMCISVLPSNWYEGKTLDYENSFNRCFILGVDNELMLDKPLCPENYPPSGLINAPARNFLIGSNNKIHVSGKNVTQNILIGDSNIMGYNKNASDPDRWSFGFASHSDRNLLFGSINKISDDENDNIIIGNNNIVASKTPGANDSVTYSTNIAVGGFNSAFDGSNQINIGYHNETNGHFAGTIGRYLASHGNQLIVGQLNDYESTQPATLLASAWYAHDNTAGTVANTGVLFAVGNGRVNAFEYNHEYYTAVEGSNPAGKITEADIYPGSQYVTWSNAMLVSANGTVSAKTYKADASTPLGKLFDFIETLTDLTAGKLFWNGTAWSLSN